MVLCKVSVIIPTFETPADMLGQCLESVLAQTVRDIEVIVVDDGSSCAFSGVKQKFVDSRLIWVEHSENQGVSECRNVGVVQSGGEWIAFLDADDWWAQNKLELQLIEAGNSGVSWVYSSAYLTDQYGDVVSVLKATNKGYVFPDLLKQQIIVGSASSVVVRRDLIYDRVYFDRDVVEDWDMWLQIARNYEVSFVPDPVVFIRVGRLGRRSAQFSKIARIKKLQEKYRIDFASYGLSRHAAAHLCYMKFRVNFISKRYLGALFYLVSGMVKYPFFFNLKRVVSWVLELIRSLP